MVKDGDRGWEKSQQPAGKHFETGRTVRAGNKKHDRKPNQNNTVV